MHRTLLALVCFVCGAAAAEKPRELVHPYPSTGPAEVAGSVPASKMLRTMQRYTMPAFTDLLAMQAAQALQGASDEPVAVVRKPRQGGNEAANFVAAAAPDGRTLLLASSVQGAELQPPGSRMLQPVALVATMPYVLIARSESNAESRGLIAQFRDSHRRVLVASAGERSAGHQAIEVLRSRTGLPLEPVAYNGGHAALNALVTKQVGIAIVPLPAVLPYLGGGRLTALVIAQSQRHASIPDVQTSAEAALGELQATASFAVLAPARTPPALIRQLQAALARGFDGEATRKLFNAIGLDVEQRILVSLRGEQRDEAIPLRTSAVRHEIATSPRSSR